MALLRLLGTGGDLAVNLNLAAPRGAWPHASGAYARPRGAVGRRPAAGASSGAPFGRRVHTLSMSRASPALFLVCGSFETWFVHPEGHASRAGASPSPEERPGPRLSRRGSDALSIGAPPPPGAGRLDIVSGYRPIRDASADEGGAMWACGADARGSGCFSLFIDG